jgi:hypothetical protein
VDVLASGIHVEKGEVRGRSIEARSEAAGSTLIAVGMGTQRLSVARLVLSIADAVFLVRGIVDNLS